MKIRNILPLLSVTAIIAGCAQKADSGLEKAVEPKVVEEQTVTNPEPIHVYEWEDRNLLGEYKGLLSTDTIGTLRLYKDGKKEIEINSKLGSLRAIDYNNDGLFDQFDGDLRRYADNFTLSQVERQIIEQNRN